MAQLAALAVSLAQVGLQTHQSLEARQDQKRAQRTQRQAQSEAQARAVGERRRAQDAQRQANRRGPDIGTLLGDIDAEGARGASTLLTGPAGVNPERLRLGKRSLLGE